MTDKTFMEFVLAHSAGGLFATAAIAYAQHAVWPLVGVAIVGLVASVGRFHAVNR